MILGKQLYIDKRIIVLMIFLGISGQITAIEKGNIQRGKEAFTNCSACHQVGDNAKNAFGPILTGVVGRDAEFAGYTYSKSLSEAKSKGLTWTTDLLFEWLMGPTDFLKKFLNDDKAISKMPVQFADEQLRKDVIAYLSSIKEDSRVIEMSHGNAPHGSQEKIVTSKPDEIDKLPHVKQVLVKPPFVPEHEQINISGSRVVEVELTVVEKELVVDSKGTKLRALTYNGSIPAPAIIVHEDDYVQLTLINPASNIFEHNIDLHAATGALGGAAITTVVPGEQTVLRFKADRPGVFLYHCAPEGVMTPYHVTHGMGGIIMVIPKGGIKDENGKHLAYDKAYFIGESEFYIPKDKDGKYKTYGETGEDLGEWVSTMRSLVPSHIVFNGKEGALTGENALTAKTGENVLFIHMQANRDSRPHLIGGQGDYVWETGSFTSPPSRYDQTWFIRGGSAGAAMHRFRQPGTYVYLNHNLIEAVLFGAAAHVKVEGEWDNSIMKQVYKGAISKKP